MPDARMLTVQDLAARLNVRAGWVYAKVEQRELPYVKVGRYVRFEAAAIDAWLERQRQQASA